MSDPLSDVENKKGQIDMGIMGARVYEGALQETGSRFRAWLITYAFWAGMFKGSVKRNQTMRRKFRLWVIHQRRVMALPVSDEWIYTDATVDSKGRLCFSNGAKMKIWCRDYARNYTYVY